MLIKLDKICWYLKWLTSTLWTVVSDRIYFWEPMREQTWPYIVLNSISQVIDTPITKQALVEARIIWHDENDTKKSLVNIASILNDELITTDTLQLQSLNWFNVYKITEGWDFRMFIDDKNRNILIKDYVFYFLN